MTVSKAVAQRDEQKSHALVLRNAIKQSGPQFELALPRHVNADRFVRSALTALNNVPKLNQCTQTSILAGLMQAAQLGLEVADVQGQFYLIPRKVKGTMTATAQLGYKGMIDLAARAGITVDVDVIRDGDQYDYERGTTPRLYHKPALSGRGDAIAYYAVGTFADGRAPSFVIMGRDEVEQHRDRFASSRDYNSKEISGPWVDHFDAMARKTVIKRLLTYLPTSAELRQQIIDVETSEPADVGALDMVPAGVDAVTGEIEVDPTTAIDATSAESS